MCGVTIRATCNTVSVPTHEPQEGHIQFLKDPGYARSRNLISGDLQDTGSFLQLPRRDADLSHPSHDGREQVMQYGLVALNIKTSCS